MKFKDPICGMEIDPKKTKFSTLKNGKEYFDYTEMDLSQEEMGSDNYTRMEDDWRKAHITILREDINPSTLTRHSSFDGDIF